MSRLAKRPIEIPSKVEFKIQGTKVEAKGPKGVSSIELLDGILIKVEDNKIFVSRDEKKHPKTNFLGLYWALISNLVKGVIDGFEKRLSLIGVGYRAQMKGKALDLQVGYSHPTILDVPEGIDVKIEQKGVEIVIGGIDKQKVGHFAALVRAVRPPEPYKGKGIRYVDEYVRKKAGKSAKS